MKIVSDLKLYNANTRDANVGDCVKRALSVAFGEDYDAVSRELNQIKRNRLASAFNIPSVFSEFMKRRGVQFSKYPDKETVEEFSENHPSGTYILLTGGKSLAARGDSNHMLTVIDGDVYDSWNSLDEVVVQWSRVTSNKVEFPDVSVADVIPELHEYLQLYCKKYTDSKFPWGRVYLKDFYKNNPDGVSARNIRGYVNKYTFKLILVVELGDNIPKSSDYVAGWVYRHLLTVKLNIRMDAAQNIESLSKKCKQKIYDYVYNIRKDILDAEKGEQFESHPEYRGNNKELMRFPEWARKRITDFWDYGESGGWDRYFLEIEALPGDPRAKSRPKVTFRSDTLRELKYDLEAYKKNFSRLGYDY